MEHCTKKYLIAVMLFVIAIIVIILSCYLIGNGANCWVSCGIIAIAVLSILLVIGLLCCPCNKESTITKEKMDKWIRDAINNNIHIKIDDCTVSFMNRQLNQNILELQDKITRKIDNVHLVQTSYLPFLEKLATEIGKSESAWKKEDIDKFMECFGSITESLKKITSENGNHC